MSFRVIRDSPLRLTLAVLDCCSCNFPGPSETRMFLARPATGASVLQKSLPPPECPDIREYRLRRAFETIQLLGVEYAVVSEQNHSRRSIRWQCSTASVSFPNLTVHQVHASTWPTITSYNRVSPLPMNEEVCGMHKRKGVFLQFERECSGADAKSRYCPFSSEKECREIKCIDDEPHRLDAAT